MGIAEMGLMEMVEMGMVTLVALVVMMMEPLQWLVIPL